MYKIYSNRIVLSDEIVKGYILVDEGKIKDIVRDQEPQEDGINLTDKYILPGLVNLTSTEYSNEINAKENKYFSDKKVFHTMDKASAEAGVTTNFNLFSLEELLKDQTVEDAIEQLRKLKAIDYSTVLVDHKTHLLFRLGDKLSNKNLREMIINDVIDFITCTGYFSKGTFNYQNQYMVQNMQQRYELNDAEASIIFERLTAIREEIALDELSFRIKSAKSKHIPFASNRNILIEKLLEEYKVRIKIISGEHTEETLNKIKEKDMFYGIELVSLTKSQDIISLLEHFRNSKLKLVLSSSRPQDIISYIFELEGYTGLFNAVNLFTKNPAQAAELDDRGEIAVGKKADFVVVEIIDDLPINTMTIKNGKIIVEYKYHKTS